MARYTFIHGGPSEDDNLLLIRRHTASAASQRRRLGEGPPKHGRVEPFESRLMTLNFRKGSGRSSADDDDAQRSRSQQSQQDPTLMTTNSRRILPRPPKTSVKIPHRADKSILKVPIQLSPPESLLMAELIFRSSSDFISSTFLSTTNQGRGLPVPPSDIVRTAWSPLPTTYLVLFKMAFDILESGSQSMSIAFQIFDALLSYAPNLLRVQNPTCLFAYMDLLTTLLGPSSPTGRPPWQHIQLKDALRRQLTLTARVILGKQHPITVVCDSLINNCQGSTSILMEGENECRTEASSACLQQIVNETKLTWGEESAQHMIVACHFSGGVLGTGFSVSWARPSTDGLHNVVVPISGEAPQESAAQPAVVPDSDEVAVVSPVPGGTSLTFGTGLEWMHVRVPALTTLMRSAMALFAALSGIGMIQPQFPSTPSSPQVHLSDATRALLDCVSTDDAVRVHLGWRLRADGTYALAFQP